MAVLGTALRWAVGVGFVCTLAFELGAILSSEVCEVRTSRGWIEPGTLVSRCEATAICDGTTLREGAAWTSHRRVRGRSTRRCAEVGETVRYYPMLGRFRADGPVAGWSYTIAAAIVGVLGFAAARQLDPPPPRRAQR
jgi:hypothetical protein